MLRIFRLKYYLDNLFSLYRDYDKYSREDEYILDLATRYIQCRPENPEGLMVELKGRSFDSWLIKFCEKIGEQVKSTDARYLTADILGQREQYRSAIKILKENYDFDKCKQYPEQLGRLLDYYLGAFRKYRDIELHKEGIKVFEECFKLIKKHKIRPDLSKHILTDGTYLYSCLGLRKRTHAIYKYMIDNNYPLSPTDLTNFSFCCWENQDWENFHKYHIHRCNKQGYDYFGLIYSGRPMWTGNEDISDKTLLVQFEQGLGDNILMFGYMERLTKLAKKVIFMCEPELAPLLKDNKWGIKIVPFEHLKFNKLRFDYWIESMSIPNALKLDTESMRLGGGYIEANSKLVQKYKKKYFNNNNLKVGVAYRGHANGQLSRQVNTEQLLELDNIEGISIYYLDMGIANACGNKFKNNKPINIVKDTAKSFADTAAIIENCDIILSTDNGLLNLAGAMGKRTLGLFNTDYHFRWYDLNKKDCGYYDSVRPFVNKELDNWDKTISDAIGEIKKYVRRKQR